MEQNIFLAVSASVWIMGVDVVVRLIHRNFELTQVQMVGYREVLTKLNGKSKENT